MVLVNGKYHFSKDLIMQSTVIQDMLNDCGGELPDEISLPNVISDIDQETIDELKYISERDIDVWIIPKVPTVLPIFQENTLQLAIRMDMRYMISKIMYACHKLFEKFIEVPNVLKACLENCNGYAYHVLRAIIDLNKIRPLATAIYHLQEIIDAEKNTKSVLTTSCSRGILSLQLINGDKFFVQRMRSIDIQQHDFKKRGIFAGMAANKICQHLYLSAINMSPDANYYILIESTVYQSNTHDTWYYCPLSKFLTLNKDVYVLTIPTKNYYAFDQ